MDSIKMNPQLGKKWFIFYTKVRPWFALFAFLTSLIDFFAYAETYLSVWWLLLSLAFSVAQAVLAIMVFVKSKGDYVELVRFIKGVLWFETVNIAYQQAVRQYIESEFNLPVAIIMFIIIFALAFFLWYRLNMKYFKKRVSTADTLQVEGLPWDTTVTRYCTNCGNKLDESCNFCNKCGTRVLK